MNTVAVATVYKILARRKDEVSSFKLLLDHVPRLSTISGSIGHFNIDNKITESRVSHLSTVMNANTYIVPSVEVGGKFIFGGNK